MMEVAAYALDWAGMAVSMRAVIIRAAKRVEMAFFFARRFEFTSYSQKLPSLLCGISNLLRRDYKTRR